MHLTPSSATPAGQQPAAHDSAPFTRPEGVARALAGSQIPGPDTMTHQADDASVLAQRSVAVLRHAPPPLPGLPSGITARLQAAFLGEDHDQIARTLDEAISRYGLQAVVSHRMDCDFFIGHTITYKNASLFFLACRSASLESVKLLSAAGTDCLEDGPECSTGSRGRTPLVMAVQYGKSAVVEYLLSLGANIDAVDSQGTPVELFNIIFNARRPGEYKTIARLLTRHREKTSRPAPLVAEKMYCQSEQGRNVRHTLYVRGLSIALDSSLAIELAELVTVMRHIQNGGQALDQGDKALLERVILILKYAAMSPSLGQLLPNLYKDSQEVAKEKVAQEKAAKDKAEKTQGAQAGGKEPDGICIGEMLEALHKAAKTQVLQQQTAVKDAEEIAKTARIKALAGGADAAEQRNALAAADSAVKREKETEQALRKALAELEGDLLQLWLQENALPWLDKVRAGADKAACGTP